MKHVTASLTIGACLLLSSAGAGLATDPHHFTTNPTGQPGTTNGITCNSTVGPGPGGSANGNASPFNIDPTKPVVYAGNSGNPTFSGPGGNGSPVGNPLHAVSQYDVACFQAP